jgi:hypothetical protein
MAARRRWLHPKGTGVLPPICAAAGRAALNAAREHGQRVRAFRAKRSSDPHLQGQLRTLNVESADDEPLFMMLDGLLRR